MKTKMFEEIKWHNELDSTHFQGSKSENFVNIFGMKGKTNKLQSEIVEDLIINKLKLFKFNNNIVTTLYQIPLIVSDIDIQRAMQQSSFNKVLSRKIVNKPLANLIGFIPELPPINDNIITFKNINIEWDIMNQKFIEVPAEKRKHFGKIILDFNFKEEVGTELEKEWIDMVTNKQGWNSNLNEINRLFAGIFMPADIVKNRRTSFIWNSKGGLGKTTFFKNIEDELNSEYVLGAMNRDFTGTNAELSLFQNVHFTNVNLIDDRDGINLTEEFANEHVKYKWKAKNYGEGAKPITSTLTTFIFTNKLNNNIEDENQLKKFDYIESNNSHYRNNNFLESKFKYFNGKYKKLINYIVTTMILDPKSLFETNQLTVDTFKDSLDEEILEVGFKLRENLNNILNLENWTRLTPIYQALGLSKAPRGDKEQKILVKKELVKLEQEGKIISRKNGVTVEYKLVNYVENMNLNTETKENDPNKGKIDIKSNDLEALETLEAIKEYDSKNFKKLILNEDVIVLDVEPLDNQTAFTQEIKDVILEIAKPNIYSYTKGGIHMWFKNSTNVKFVKTELEEQGMIIEIKTKDIFTKDNYHFNGVLTEILSSPFSNNIKIKESKKNTNIKVDFENDSILEQYSLIKDWNCNNNQTLHEIVENYRDGNLQRNNTLFNLKGWFEILGFQKQYIEEFIYKLNKSSVNPLEKNEILQILRRK